MNHAKKKRGVPDAMSGTPLRSVCGILCGQRKSAKSYSFKKLQKSKENTRNPKISGVVLSCVDKKDVHSRVFQRSSQAAKPQKAGSDQSRGEYACKRTGGGSAALRREGEAKQTLLQRGRSVIKGFVKIQ